MWGWGLGVERVQAPVGVDCTAEDGVGAGPYLLGVASPDVMQQVLSEVNEWRVQEEHLH